MKKIFTLFSVLLLAVVLASCGESTYEVAMITDTGDIDDGSFNQGTWEGIKEYTKEHSKTRKYYKPGGETTADYVAAIDLAIAGGAKIVITPGFYFETPIFEAQTKYPDVKFVILDGAPHNGDYNINVASNTLSIFFKEEESGFLAGYASVMEGLDNLGYMGGIAVPAVQRFGIGYVAGAYQAAKEMNKDIVFTANHYTYLGTFGPSDEYKNEAATWYSSGVDVIHAAAGGAGSSVMAAAKDATDKWVVGVDSDQSKQSDTVLTSAVKGVGQAAYDALEQYYANTFPGGSTWNLGAKEKAVGLPMATSRFSVFTQANYEAVLARLVAGTLVAPATASALETFLNDVAGSGATDWDKGIIAKVAPSA